MEDEKQSEDQANQPSENRSKGSAKGTMSMQRSDPSQVERMCQDCGHHFYFEPKDPDPIALLDQGPRRCEACHKAWRKQNPHHGGNNRKRSRRRRPSRRSRRS